MRIFTSDEDLILTGKNYLSIAGWSYLLMAFPQVYLCIMKNSGRIIRSTLYGSITVVLNIVLNAVFIFGFAIFPEMGASGAAAATVIAIGAELVFVLIENSVTDTVRIRWNCVKVINIRLLGGGTEIIIGNELGKNNPEAAKWYGSYLLRISVRTGIFSGILLILLTPLFVRLSSSLSAQASGYLKWMLIICAVYMMGKSVNVTLIDGIFCAGGDTRFGLWCDLTVMWIIIGPLGAIAAFILKWPVPLVYLILNLDECIKVPIAYRHYKKNKWVKKLT